jgi:glutathionyl-hydroquinone reductase
MRGLFGEGMSETHQVLFIAEKLLHQFLPKLEKHLEKENVHITMYATQWLLTLYTSSFRFDLVTRVWDVFLAEGWKIVYRVMLALLQYAQPVLMTLNFEEMLAYFRELPEQVDASKIMDIALKIPLRKKHLVRYTNDYQKRPR